MRTVRRLILVQVTSLTVSNTSPLSQTWTERASIPTPCWYPASVVLNGKIYVIGGQDSTYPYGSLSTVEVSDPVTEARENKAPITSDRWGLMVAVVNNKIYAIGVRNGSASGGHSATNAVEEYDPTTDTWTPKTSMPTPLWLK